MLAFNSQLAAWKPQLVRATPQTRLSAINFISTLPTDEMTDCYAALRAALTMDTNVEAIYFLSDGKPTAGAVTDMPTIVQQATQWNAFSRTSLNTIGIDSRDLNLDFLNDLADGNYGEFTLIRRTRSAQP